MFLGRTQIVLPMKENNSSSTGTIKNVKRQVTE